MDDLAHGFVLQFAFEPGNNVEISKGTRLKAVVFKMLDRLQQLFKLGLDFSPRNLETLAKELEHLFFHHRQIFHFGHEAVDGFSK